MTYNVRHGMYKLN